jgi:glycerol-3-phosphate acyltransferase PlsY
MARTLVLIVAAYLAGSIPTAYLVGKLLRGRDVRRYGSGTVSASLVWEHVARWATIPVGAFDLAKATIPTWLAAESGLSSAGVVAVGLAAIIGHNWPVFLRFVGGRGVSTFLGVLVVVYPMGAVWILGLMVIGRLLGSTAVWTLGAIVGLPVLSTLAGGPAVVPALSAAMLVVTVAKRVEANRRPIRGDRTRVLLRRVFLDRDVPSTDEWVERTPD